MGGNTAGVFYRVDQYTKIIGRKSCMSKEEKLKAETQLPINNAVILAGFVLTVES